MKIRKKISIFLGLMITFFFLAIGFNNLGNVQSKNVILADTSSQLTVSAAASLKDVIEEIKPLYEQKYPQVKITYNFGSSGSLQQQIEHGAPVDIFISAANKQMDTLEEKKLLLAETRRDLVSNQMVLVIPKNGNKSVSKIDNFKDLTHKNITTIALGEPQSVPAGKYAQEVLNYYKITDQINGKAVYGKNVRQVLNYVVTGNVDAGIVYGTDAQMESKVNVVAIAPSGSHSPVVYPIAVIKDSKNPQESQQLINFLTTSEIQKIFTKYGFSSANGK